jgi:hypothetical protein
MKKNLYITMCTVILLLLAPSCKKDFTEINTNPNTSPVALPEQLLAPALVNTVSANMLKARQLNNELVQITVSETDAEGSVFRYDIRPNQSDAVWNNLYTQLGNFKDIYSIASTPLNLSKGYQGIALICQAWIYSILTDTFGDIPYFQSNMAKQNNFEPVFDKQKDIYADIFKQLELANTTLTTASNVVGTSDPVFNGSVSAWRKFGNSLYLRLLLRLSGKAEVSTAVIAQIKNMVDTNPGTYPIMTSNTDAAVLRWTGTGYLTSPFVNGVREQDWRAPAISTFFLDNLTKWTDPRLYTQFSGLSGGVWSIATSNGSFVGVPSGYTPGTAPTAKSYFYSTASLTTKKSYETEPLSGNILNYAELQFILAECAIKGFISNVPAKTYYDNGVAAAITFWLPTYFTTPSPTVPITLLQYETQAGIVWDDAAPLDTKMETIHVQKYYTLFWTDEQEWFEIRRTGHPVLPKGPGLVNNKVMPARLVYPTYVQSANPANYTLAVAGQGPDVISTQVWWQKP